MHNLCNERAGLVQARFLSLLLLFVLTGFAAGCSKTETVRADPATVRAQEAQTEAAGTEETEKPSAEATQAAASQEQAAVRTEENRDSAEETTRITFTAVGDNLINEVLYEQAAQRADGTAEGRAYDFAPCYEKIAPFIREHDINWIDIETLMTDTLQPSGYPAFSTPGDSGRALIDAGWNVFSLCSNHTYDQGAEGIRQTLDFWKTMQEETASREKTADDGQKTADDGEKSADDGEKTAAPGREEGHTGPGASGRANGICCTGLWEYGTEYDIPVLTCKGKKIAFLTYTYGTNNIETPADSPAHVIYLDEEGLMAYQIELARQQADAVVVSLHWGEEYNHEQTQDQRALAQRVADMGADLIIGGHPHVVQGAEMLTAADGRQVFCAYSLGNFLCAQNSMPNPDAMIGLLLSCTFCFTEDGLSVEDQTLIPILSDYGEEYENDHVVLYSNYSEQAALAHGMRTMFGFTEFDYDYVREMLTDVVGEEYLQLP